MLKESDGWQKGELREGRTKQVRTSSDEGKHEGQLCI